MIKLVGLVAKHPDLSIDDFRRHWLEVHVPIARRMPGVHRYTVNFVDRSEFPEAAYDGFSEQWFDSREALDHALSSSVADEVAHDHPSWIKDVTPVVVEEHSVIGPA